MKNHFITKAILISSCLGMALTGCKKKEVEMPTEQAMYQVPLNQLQQGQFYVKDKATDIETADGFGYTKLPFESTNLQSQEDSYNPETYTDKIEDTIYGVGDSKEKGDRIYYYTYMDETIPTLYSDTQLIYVSGGKPITTFNWERVHDLGYSIGIGGLSVTSANKLETNEKSFFTNYSTLQQGVATMTLPEGSTITFDKINGTELSSDYISTAGTIKGMSKNAIADVDMYYGTSYTPVTASADTRFFQTFETYQTSDYTLSTDGYAIVNLPPYFMSGYYMINDVGLVRYINAPKGTDESSIDFETPYFYQDKDGNIITSYQKTVSSGQITGNDNTSNVSSTTRDAVINAQDKHIFEIKEKQYAFSVTVKYKYQNEQAKAKANNGIFPQAFLFAPNHSFINGGDYDYVQLQQSSATVDDKGYYTLTYSVTNPEPGIWNLAFINFEGTYRITQIN